MNLNIIGHTKNKNYLERAWKLNKFPHSLLFSGPKSIGKFSLSMNLAYQLLIHNDINFHTVIFDEVNVKKITNFFHPSLLVLGHDEAKEITIDEIRKLGRFLSLTAAETKYRIVIIDNADNMNLNAQNGLLKILEEPPKNSLIILINHSLERLLSTVRSRTSMTKFVGLHQKEIKLIINKNFTIVEVLARLGFTVKYIEKWIDSNLNDFYQLLLNYIISFQDIFEISKIIEELQKKKKLEWTEILEILNFANIRIVTFITKDDFIYLFEDEKDLLQSIMAKFNLDNLLAIQKYISDLIIDYQEFNLDPKSIFILSLIKYQEVFELRNNKLKIIS